MWDVIALTVNLLAFVWLWRNLHVIGHRGLAALCIAIWLRMFAASFPDTTYDPVVAGLSPIALLSLATIGTLFLFIDMRQLLLRVLIPVYLLMASILISGLFAGDFKELLDPISRWMFFIAIALLTRQVIIDVGRGTTFRTISIAMLAPILLQVLSVVLNNPKKFNPKQMEMSEGGLNYIGGFYHESVFGMVVFIFIFTMANSRVLTSHFWKYSGIIWGIIGIFLANYRTLILGALPMIALMSITTFTGMIKKESRGLGYVLVMLIGLAGVIFMPSSYVDRFADVPEVVKQLDLVGKRSQEFVEEEKKLFTGRVYTWSRYLTVFRAGDPQEQFFGFGPNSWKNYFHLYAHNSFVSALFEYGYLGFGLFVFLFLAISRQVIRAVNNTNVRYLASAWLGFIITNMATMPTQGIEGMMFLGFMAALAWQNTEHP